MTISLRELTSGLAAPGEVISLRDFFSRHHPGVLSLRQAAGGVAPDSPSRTTLDVVVKVKDVTPLPPGEHLAISFFPGRFTPALLTAHTNRIPSASTVPASDAIDSPLPPPSAPTSPAGDVSSRSPVSSETGLPVQTALAATERVSGRSLDQLRRIEERAAKPPGPPPPPPPLPPGPGLPPIPPPIPPPDVPSKASVNAKVFRPGSDKPVADQDLLPPTPTLHVDIRDVDLVPEGFAPEPWIARFTNISEEPLNCFAEVVYHEHRHVHVTRLPLELLGRLLGQAVQGLGLTLRLHGNTAKIDFNEEVKHLAGLEPLEKDLDFVRIINDVRLSQAPTVTLTNEVAEGFDSPLPTIHAVITLEEDDPEISIDLGVGDIDIQISGLTFDVKLSMYNAVRPLAHSDPVRGIFPRVPQIRSELSVATDVRLSSRALGGARLPINAFLEALDLYLLISTLGRVRLKERIPKLKDLLRERMEPDLREQEHRISAFLQIAIQFIIERANDFHGIRVAGNDWEILHWPGPSAAPSPGVPGSPLPPFQNTPIDGPQPESELQNLRRIDHIVFLMMENRSFDHMLGYLSHPEHGKRSDVDGLHGHEENRIPAVSTVARPAPLPSTVFGISPPHGSESIGIQIADGGMTEFASEFKRVIEKKNRADDPALIMGFHTAGQLFAYHHVAETYGIAQRWFCSHVGPTWPNRLCAVAGRTHVLDNGDIPQADYGYLDLLTVFDILNEHSVSWRYYEHDISFLRLFTRYRLNNREIRSFERFREDAAAGLPAVTYIDPNFVDIPSGGEVNDDHPAGADIAKGQQLVADVIDALIASPGWNNTLLVITYDEHGGFYDHVPPPGSTQSKISGIAKVHPDAPAMMGVRVPALMVSPRTEARAVFNRLFDHTSVLKTILTRFAPGTEHRLSRRVEMAAHLGETVPRADPRTGLGPVPRPTASQPAQPHITRDTDEPGSLHAGLRQFGNPAHLPESVILKLAPKV